MYLSPSETIPQTTPACNPTYNTSSINLATNNTFTSTYTPAARCHYAPNWTSSPDIKVFSPGGTVTPGGGTVETL